MSRPARNRPGSNKPRPQAAKRPAGGQGTNTGTPKPGTPKPGTPKPGAPNPGAPAAGAAKAGAATRTADAAGPAGPARGRQALAVPGRSTWATSARLPVLIAALAGMFLLGLVVGIGGAAVHYMRLGGLPTGTVLGVLAVDGVAFSSGVLLRSRLGAVIPSLGWLVACLVLASPKAEGDILIGGAGMDYAFLVGGAATLIAFCALPYGLLAAHSDPPP